MSSGESFGYQHENWLRRRDAMGHEFSFDIERDAISESFYESLSEPLQDEITGFYYSLTYGAGGLYDKLPHQGQRQILTAAQNDTLALVRLVDRLEGRAAAGLARANFEHLVNFRDVTAAIDNTSDRYLDHRHAVAAKMSERRWHLDVLDSKARRKERNRLDGLAHRAKRPLLDAVNKYGTSFKTGWAKGTLRDRAGAHKVDYLYPGYSGLSGVIHGSSGGLTGLVRDVEGVPVHRTGPDLELTALAYEEGFASFYELATTLHSITGLPHAEEIAQRAANVLRGIPEIRRALAKLDRKMQPRVPGIPALVAVLLIYPSLKHRWIVHDTRNAIVCLAEIPDPEPDISALLEAAQRHPFELYNNRPMSSVFPRLSAHPKPGASWFPATGTLIPPPPASGDEN